MKQILVASWLVLALVAISSAQWRSHDGSDNNLDHPEWGRTYRTFLRGIEGVKNGTELPNARLVSNTLAALNGAEGPLNSHGVNMLEVMFGQFINHDLQFTLKTPAPQFIVLPPGDILAGLPGTPQIAPGTWAIIVSDTATADGEVINAQTAWLDLSTIYGTNEVDAAALRNSDGTLITSNQYACTWPPPDFTNLPCTNTVTFDDLPPSTLQVNLSMGPDVNFPSRPDGTGVFNDADNRVNSNVALTLLHTLYIRNHNYLVDELSQEDPALTGEELYRTARKLNIAMYQQHVFYEYLPTIIPNIPTSLMNYDGYDASVNPDTSYVFDFGAFRYGHSSFSSYNVVDKCNVSFQVAPDWYLQINPQQNPNKFVFAGTSGPEPFLIPDVLSAARTEANVLYSLIYSKAGQADLLISDDLRNLGAGFFPIDLFAVDILRSRLARLPDYYTLRQLYFDKYNFGHGAVINPTIYGRPDCPDNEDLVDPLTCFLYITSDVAVATKLQNLYGKITSIDAIVGMLAEDVLENYNLPATISHIIFDEYNRKRVSDRFWFEDYLTKSELKFVRRMSFEKMLRQHFNLDRKLKLQDHNPFLVARSPKNNCH